MAGGVLDVSEACAGIEAESHEGMAEIMGVKGQRLVRNCRCSEAGGSVRHSVADRAACRWSLKRAGRRPPLEVVGDRLGRHRRERDRGEHPSLRLIRITWWARSVDRSPTSAPRASATLSPFIGEQHHEGIGAARVLPAALSSAESSSLSSPVDWVSETDFGTPDGAHGLPDDDVLVDA